MKKCIECGKILTGNNNPKRCGSCAQKIRRKTEHIQQHKTGLSGLQYTKIRKERIYIRSADRRWFDRQGIKNQYEIHHDWKNGAYCYLLTPEEHKGIDKK